MLPFEIALFCIFLLHIFLFTLLAFCGQQRSINNSKKPVWSCFFLCKQPVFIITLYKGWIKHDFVMSRQTVLGIRLLVVGMC